jgi:sensor histidine kinase YesM
VLLAVCTGIALLLTALDGGRFHVKLTYALCIGLACTAVNDLGWMAQAALYDRLRALRGLPPAAGPFQGGWAGVLPSAVLCLLLGPPLGQALADSLFGFRSTSMLDWQSTSTQVTLVLSALATLVLVVVVSTFERLAAARAQAEAAQRLAAENQLRLLQSQLEPHMLFNTLANLRVLIGLDPQRAQAMLDRLIAFLRATLAASRQAEHPLADEYARLEDYLALMAVRMGPRLQVRLDLPAALQQLPVPPLLLQPLVENSIQHGLEPQVEGGCVQVTARREGEVLVLEVQDSGIGRASTAAQATASPGRPAGGFGLSGVRERLATLYGERASLTLADAPGGQGTLASVRLPIRALPSAPAAPWGAAQAATPPSTTAHSPQP